MFTLVILLLLAGLLSGLVQYFVDFKGLPIYMPSSVNESFVDMPGFLTKIVNFLNKHWQFFGYIVVGIAGAFLVPVIDQILHLKGIDQYLVCMRQAGQAACEDKPWNLLVIFGYGIISGYSSVRIIRGFGSFIIDNIGKDFEAQKVTIKKLQDEIENLKKKIKGVPIPEETAVIENNTEGMVEYTDHCDASDVESVLEFAKASTCVQFAKPWTGKKWRVAASLKQLLAEVNLLAPERSKKSDGTIGDLSHASGNSDHNPWVKDGAKDVGIVTALDITHDAANGCDCNAIAQFMQEKKDKRIKYVIWNRRIMNSSQINDTEAWTWRTYTGKNPHDKHIHISVLCDNVLYDNVEKWHLNF
jgi:hypothetical protein